MLASVVKGRNQHRLRPHYRRHNHNIILSTTSHNYSGGLAPGVYVQRGVPMVFSFADLGFWRLAVVALIFELVHGLLENHWPGIRGSRLGPRPAGAVLFMFAEAVAVGVAVMAAIGTVARLIKLPRHPVGKISAVVVMALSLVGIFLLVWQT